MIVVKWLGQQVHDTGSPVDELNDQGQHKDGGWIMTENDKIW